MTSPNIKNPLQNAVRSNSSIILDSNIWLQRIDPSYTGVPHSSSQNIIFGQVEDIINEIFSKNITVYVLPTIISEIINVTEKNNFKTWCREEKKMDYKDCNYKHDYRNNPDSTFKDDNSFLWQSINEEILNNPSVSLFNPSNNQYIQKCIDYCKSHPNVDFNDILIVYAAKEKGAALFSQDKDLQSIELDFTLYTI